MSTSFIQDLEQNLTAAPGLTPDAARDITRNPYKQDFPLLIDNPETVYLDSAATAQSPRAVIEAQKYFYEKINANPLRGLYKMSVEATQLVQETRNKVANFIGAATPDEIIFTRNTTEALNLCAYSLSSLLLKPGDTVVTTVLEHHSNFLPWQEACRRCGAQLIVLHPNKQGEFSSQDLARIDGRCKIVAVTHVSNVLGSITDVSAFAEAAHSVGALCIVDGAQSTPHLTIDVQKLGCDVFVFSAHKVFGPLGIGVLWAHKDLLNKMPPFLTGGEMIDSVSEEKTVWAPVPEKFEAGTQDAAGIAATGVALDYLSALTMAAVEAREQELISYLYTELSALPYVEALGPTNPLDRVGVVSFTMQGIHPHDVASLLDSKGVCMRAGHHCAEPLHIWLGVGSTNRASIAFYNDKHDIDALITGLRYVWSILGGR